MNISIQHHSIHIYIITYTSITDDAYSLHSSKIIELSPTPITKYGSKSISTPWSKFSVALIILVSNDLPLHIHCDHLRLADVYAVFGDSLGN